MTNWLERARREIPRTATQATANSDKRSLTAVMAVGKPANSGISESSNDTNGSTQESVLAETDKTAIRAWLEHIGETEPTTITEILNKCSTDKEARSYFIKLADEALKLPTFDGDDRRHCDECTNLTKSGLCLAARRREIKASRTFYPVDHTPKRCIGYAPGPNDSDRRPGHERWPNLYQKRRTP